jgi:hypothetical protein
LPNPTQPEPPEPEHASTQEALVHAFSQRSMSSSMLFTPSEYRKGDATREPCDLVWISRDMLILMTMQESTRSQDRQDAHNFKQLRGWLRIWESSDEKLRGKTTLQDVAFDYDSQPLVLMSITDAPDGRAAIHKLENFPKNRAEEQVILCCSLPAEALIELARTGGGAADLAALVKRLASVGGEVSAKTFVAWVSDARDAAFQRLITRQSIPAELQGEFIGQYAHQSLLSMRHSTAIPVTEKDKRESDKYLLPSLFNDIEWYGLFETVWKMTYYSKLIIEVTPGTYGPSALGDTFRSGNYTIFTAAYDSAAEGALESLMSNYPSDKAKEGYPLISIMNMIFARASKNPVQSMIISAELPTGATRTRQLYTEAAEITPEPSVVEGTEE